MSDNRILVVIVLHLQSYFLYRFEIIIPFLLSDFNYSVFVQEKNTTLLGLRFGQGSFARLTMRRMMIAAGLEPALQD